MVITQGNYIGRGVGEKEKALLSLFPEGKLLKKSWQ